MVRSPKLIMVEEGERMSSVGASPPTRPEDTSGRRNNFLAVHVCVELAAVHTVAVCLIEVNDLWMGRFKRERGREKEQYPSRLWYPDDGEMSTVEALHLGVELFVADDEDDVYWIKGEHEVRIGERAYFGKRRRML